MLSRQVSYLPFSARVETCRQPETPCRIQAEPLIPFVGVQITDFRQFIHDLRTTILQLDKSRCFPMADQVCDLCDTANSCTEEKEDCVSSLLDLADLLLVYDLQPEAYALYSRAIHITNNNSFDQEFILDAWLAIAKLLKVGRISTCSEHVEAGDQILNWLVTSYDMQEALCYMY